MAARPKPRRRPGDHAADRYGGQQRIIDPAASCPGATRIVLRTRIARRPIVEKKVAGTAIPAAHHRAGFGRWQVGQVCDTTQIQNNAMPLGVGKHTRVKGRNERRAMSSGSHVATPEVSNDIDATQFGEPSRRIELDRVAELRLVADRLAVRPDRGDRDGRGRRLS